MAQYPMDFTVSAAAGPGIDSAWQTTPHTTATALKMAVPPEFDGPGAALSPEDLYAMALANCFVATFKVIAAHSKLQFANLAVNTVLTVDKNEQGAPWMAKAQLTAVLSGCDRPEKAELLLAKTANSCLILNSVKTVKTFEFVVEPL